MSNHPGDQKRIDDPTACGGQTRRAVWSSLIGAGLAASLPRTARAAPTIEDLFGTAARGTGRLVDHSIWDGLLKLYVRPHSDGINRVDYRSFKANGAPALNAYIRSLEATDVRDLGRGEKIAFLANLYNAKTISIIIEHYPVASIKDISLGGGLLAAVTGGPWKAHVTAINGLPLSLDDIEHTILRPIFKDPRIHYIINCASRGCPNLATSAHTGAKLETAMEAGARAFVNHARGFSVTNGQVVTSSIYSWFKPDFGGSDQSVLAHARTYAEAPLAAQLKGKLDISGHQYDWKLNDLTA